MREGTNQSTGAWGEKSTTCMALWYVAVRVFVLLFFLLLLLFLMLGSWLIPREWIPWSPRKRLAPNKRRENKN